ncbi:hypothetical protein GCM10009718_06690 [Isoptericola halotolerans]|uniref:DUF4164 family protein n=1 Tax=Isoptericola halotolerans TaxID=300560 RepID=A0ABX2A0T3_9MICO|nr:hypothetical protein [Isoptericola halotolerans]NOV96409.1 hypothetical protein [Isoptericola halotolerans]
MTEAPSPGLREHERELAAILDEAEQRIGELRLELSRREDLSAQHAELDRLDEHLATARVSWSEVRGFFDDVLHQLRGRGNPPAGDEAPGGLRAAGREHDDA